MFGEMRQKEKKVMMGRESISWMTEKRIKYKKTNER